MSRRGDSQRIYQAGRAAIRNRLLSDGLSPERTEYWLTAWELEASIRQMATTGDWTVGDAWIAE
jgi:hypothetical protein